ncbi:diacylglycerol/lipid kinase family protein [Lacticaseibacillus saniviri]|nr:diacylglycerol kinase family protein [Lacticaseibacillus saniviri]MCG4282970.1 diacylglycerol kinase family lipid kinase [Lacticaseibacillus saniviri]
MTEPFFYIIVNPVAGSGNGAKTWQQIQPIFEQRHLDYQVKVSQYAGHTIELAKQIGNFATHDQAVLIVVGGDGTLNQALTGLRATKTPLMPLAYVPTGSGNDFARGTDINQDPLKALEQILSATQPVSIDVGQYSETTHHHAGYFVNNIGIGFDAAVVASTNHSKAKQWLNRVHLGNLAYGFNVLKVLFKRKPFALTVNVDGQQIMIPDAFLVTTTNHPYFGGGVKILPAASPTDGKLDLIVVEHTNLITFVFLAIQLLRGQHTKYAKVHHFQSKHIQLMTNSLEYGQMDGEEMGTRAFALDFKVSQHPFWYIPENK